MITPTRIAEIRARLEAATPGPWEWTGNALDQSENPYQEVISTEVSCGAYCLGGMWAPGIDEDDKALIANAPADLADLLAALDAAQAERDTLDNAGLTAAMQCDAAISRASQIEAERDAATARAEQAEAERDKYINDLELSAGALSVPCPAPGTDMARVLVSLRMAQAETRCVIKDRNNLIKRLLIEQDEQRGLGTRAQQAEAEATALRAEVARRHEGLVAQIQDALVWAHNRGASGAPMIAYRYRAEEAIASADEAIRVVQEGAPHD